MVLGTTVHAEARHKRALQLVDERVVVARAGAEAVHRVRALDGLPFAHESGYIWILVLVRVMPVGQSTPVVFAIAAPRAVVGVANRRHCHVRRSPLHATVVVVNSGRFLVDDGGVHRAPRVLAGAILRQVRASVDQQVIEHKRTRSIIVTCGPLAWWDS